MAALVLTAVFPFAGAGCRRRWLHRACPDCQEDGVTAAGGDSVTPAGSPEPPLLCPWAALSPSFAFALLLLSYPTNYARRDLFRGSILENYEGAILLLTGIFGTHQPFSDVFSDVNNSVFRVICICV